MPGSDTRRFSRPLLLLALGIGLLLALVLSLAVGANLMPAGQVVNGLLGADADAAVIVQGVRVPRTVIGAIVGAGLGVAGTIMQSVTRNPIADPGLLGINAGAAAAVVTAISVLGLTQPAQFIWFALAGSLVAVVAVYLIGSGPGSAATPVRLALAGAAVGASLTSYVYGVMLADPWAFTRFRYWDIGALSGRTVADTGPSLWIVGAGLLCAIALLRPLNAIALGEDTARALGANLAFTRAMSIIAVTLLCGGATAAVGPIAFVGLAVPHIARLVAGVDHHWLVPASALLGATVLVAADVTGRLIAWPQEVGVGIVTALVGAPVLIALVRHRTVTRL